MKLSLAENFSLSLVEAMASGLPAVALRSQDSVGRIPPGNGVDVVDQQELPSMAGLCVSLTRDKEHHDKCARNARVFVEQLSMDQVLPRFMDFHRCFAH